MLTAAEVQAVLDAVTWYPGWVFVAYDHEYEGLAVLVHAVVPDAYHAESDVEVDIHCPVDYPVSTPGELLAWLDRRTQRIASHEEREWLRVHGRPVSDPHGGDTPAMVAAAKRAREGR
jgi:hypothetical protein